MTDDLKEGEISGMYLQRDDHVKRQWGVYLLRNRDLRWNQLCWLCDLKLPVSKTRNVCCLVHSVCAILLWHLWKLMHKDSEFYFGRQFLFYEELFSWTFGWVRSCKLPKKDRCLTYFKYTQQGIFQNMIIF